MGPVIIFPYDAEWPAEFDRERVRLARALEGMGVVIEHVGSTAVPGLGAKPIVDILAGVASLSDVEARIPRLEALGYEYVPKYEREFPERRFFRRFQEGMRTHHLHCVLLGSGFWLRQLRFRDYLCAHADTAAAYFELKNTLAARYLEDRVGYTEAKSGFIESVLARADKEDRKGSA